MYLYLRLYSAHRYFISCSNGLLSTLFTLSPLNTWADVRVQTTDCTRAASLHSSSVLPSVCLTAERRRCRVCLCVHVREVESRWRIALDLHTCSTCRCFLNINAVADLPFIFTAVSSSGSADQPPERLVAKHIIIVVVMNVILKQRCCQMISVYGLNLQLVFGPCILRLLPEQDTELH